MLDIVSNVNVTDPVHGYGEKKGRYMYINPEITYM